MKSKNNMAKARWDISAIILESALFPVLFLFLFSVSALFSFRPLCWAGASWSFETGGQVKFSTRLTKTETNTIQELGKNGPWKDTALTLRIKQTARHGDLFHFTLHYLAQGREGDSLEAISNLSTIVAPRESSSTNQVSIFSGKNTRETNFFDLFSTPSRKEHHLFTHGLDRMALAYTPQWGSLTLGRQAITWGNGLVFNPMDIFNPFSPSEIDRDYKPGADMIHFRTSPWDMCELQLIHVPRRDPDTGNLSSDQSSWGAKFHLMGDTTEMDIMAASHRRDTLVGAGITGYLGGAAWRLDGVYTWSGGEKNQNYVNLVANMDYSWIWFEKNFYGFLELFYSDLGSGDYTRLYTDPDIRDRIATGELYFMGRTYAAANLQMEIHPLFNTFITFLHNVEDPSGLVQPRMVWSPHQNLELTLGADLYYGKRNTEFGKNTIPGTDLTTAPGNDAYFWATLFF